MKYLFIAIAFILSVYVGHRVVANMPPDMSQESGLERTIPVDQTQKQAEEDDSIHNTQRQGDNHVPRQENEVKQ